ncbi:MAG: hypothetical protein ABIW94_12880 [Gemmatimonadaceae bacterium]
MSIFARTYDLSMTFVERWKLGELRKSVGSRPPKRRESFQSLMVHYGTPTEGLGPRAERICLSSMSRQRVDWSDIVLSVLTANRKAA